MPGSTWSGYKLASVFYVLILFHSLLIYKHPTPDRTYYVYRVQSFSTIFASSLALISVIHSRHHSRQFASLIRANSCLKKTKASDFVHVQSCDHTFTNLMLSRIVFAFDSSYNSRCKFLLPKFCNDCTCKIHVADSGFQIFCPSLTHSFFTWLSTEIHSKAQVIHHIIGVYAHICRQLSFSYSHIARGCRDPMIYKAEW